MQDAGSRDYWEKSGGVFTLTYRIISKYPQLLFPLLLVWLVYAPTILYLKYYFPWHDYSTTQSIAIDYLIFTGFSLLLSFSCLIMLEVIRQIEVGEPVELMKAARKAASPDLGRAIPIAMVWAAIWLTLTLLEVIFGRIKEKGDGSDGSFNMRGAAETLTGYDRFTLSGAFFAALNKGVRMLVFMVLPAIAWEDEGARSALRRGLSIAGKHKFEFAKGFAVTWVVSALLFLPASLFLYFTSKFHVVVPDYVYAICIVYVGLAWSLSMLIEQLFAAILYLWHIKWLKLHIEALKEKKLLFFYQVPPPTLLEDDERLLKEPERK